ncbi:beta-galactosidase [Streptomyces ipomoeae]|uniref:glycoside hydrolase family 35 protein n=1 Tax=Streptomyces ipomoeae TaxID=103232 RepID=UPI0011469148|nr:glycoside hydrolase family 35 protein [Streptomyces ipomoeae]MDX2828243.1 beta-galactosidase [Streptomyces ipomoeae]MDX2880733.1 beta-galactosidase [Streptomyces ipomoeae]TQE29051.1 beta-galactosidase [Streptomyces ipomoeae]
MTEPPTTHLAPAHTTTETAPDAATGALTWDGGRLYRHGVPHRILSGGLHYFRVHPDLWRDRIRRLADLGLNTVDTYVPWNFHQPREHRPPSFDGWRDLERFIGTVGEEGLDVVVRPGPYICAEWSNGGLPSWLTGRDVAIRSSDPAFTSAVDHWFDELIPRIAALQTTEGGPVVAVQVENEFGSYGDDHAYLRWNRRALTTRGIRELLFTADGPTELMQDGGTLPGTLAAVTLGSRPAAARRLLTTRRPDEPFLVAEFWNGWFDHWGKRHHVRGVDSAVGTLRDILADDGSVSIYMAHGGTNFGLWAGANEEDGRLRPIVTSYDSDAPIAEDGALTAKFFAVREALGARKPVRSPARPPTLPPARRPLVHRADLLPGLRAVPAPTVTAPRPASFEQLGLDAGMVLHTAHPRIPTGEHRLVLTDVRDRALVFTDGTLVGVADAEHPELPVHGTGDVVRLEVLVESLGRVNYGPGIGRHKGLLGPVLVDRRGVQGWDSTPVALQEWGVEELAEAVGAGRGTGHGRAAGHGTGLASAAGHAAGQASAAGHGIGQASAAGHTFAAGLDITDRSAVGRAIAHARAAGPAVTHRPATARTAAAGFGVATFQVDGPADTFLALPGSGRGLVWVNGFLLGRHWDIGPQVTLYCPAPLLRAGENTVTVLELEHLGDTLELRDRPELGPTEEYIEEFD